MQFGDIRLTERFWRNVTENAETRCWEANRPNATTGYGQISYGRGNVRNRHRVTYEVHVGPIPEGHQIDHLCRVRSCCNPAHLEAVTQAENIRRGLAGELRPERTECKRGHQLTLENTYVNPRGIKECRDCYRLLKARRTCSTYGR